MPREIMDFNSGWLFHKGDDLPKEATAYGNMCLVSDETRIWQKAGNHGLSKPENPHVDAWRKLDLPHDFVLENDYDSRTSPSNGSLPHGKAWYVKKFELPEKAKAGRVHIEFDGVYRDCKVWLNGNYVGANLSGYTSFGFDLSEACRFGAMNAIAVLVDASENELWSYEGGGLYRGVRLLFVADAFVPRCGVYVRTGGADEPGRTEIAFKIANSAFATKELEAVVKVLSPEGLSLASSGRRRLSVEANGETKTELELSVESPRLWTLEDPALHVLELELFENGRPVDLYRQSFGYRHFAFDPETGFSLNGERMKLKGVCCHQDHAGVGVAVPPALQEWRVWKLKSVGCNAVRTSHNPPDPAFLDACDKLGMLVMDEQRQVGASGEILGQLESLVVRDRNHPSVILWSLGNEEMGVQEREEGVRMFRRMQSLVNKLDPSRPATYAMNCEWLKIAKFHDAQGFRFNVFGANYRNDQRSSRYDEFHELFPDWPILGSETWGGVATRGLYEPDKSSIPYETSRKNPELWGEPEVGRFPSAYGNYRNFWGYTIEETWQDCAKRPFLAGTFIWTGFDYRGETTPYRWPAVVSRYGILDYCGFLKEIAHYLKSWWLPEEPHVFLMPHWSWPGREGEELLVRCYSNCAEVELRLNGRSLGRSKMPRDGKLEWLVAYEPGELLAQGFAEDGAETARDVKRTAKAPKALKIAFEGPEPELKAGAILVANVEVVDKDGTPCPLADDEIEFSVEGPAELLGLGGGSPMSHEKDKGTTKRKAYHGLCQAIIQANGKDGEIVVEAKANGLKGAKTRSGMK